MRIAVVTRYAHRVGGVETYLDAVLPALTARGHDVHLWHEYASPPESPPEQEPSLAQATPRSEIGVPANVNAVLEDLRQWRPDVIFLHGLAQGALEQRLEAVTGVVVFLHAYHGTCVSGTKMFARPEPQTCQRTLGPGCLALYFPRRCGGLNPRTMLTSYAEQQRRLALLARSRAVVTFSDHMRNEVLAHGVRSERVVRLPPIAPYGSTDMPWPDDRSASLIQSGRPHLAFIGRMEPLKGPGTLMDALACLSPEVQRRLHVTFVGDGADRDLCERRAERLRPLGIEVRFAGTLSSTERDRVLQTVDLLVVPSLWPEPLGLVGIEAGSHGIPAVAFNVGGIGEWLHDNITGRLIDGTTNAETLAHGIDDCLSDAPRLRRWGAAARESARHLTIAAHVEPLEAVLRNAADAAGVDPARAHA